MTRYKNKYRAETTRLKGWDYTSAGWYFVTICTRDRVRDHFNRTIVINYEDNVETSRRDVSTIGPRMVSKSIGTIINQIKSIVNKRICAVVLNMQEDRPVRDTRALWYEIRLEYQTKMIDKNINEMSSLNPGISAKS